MEVREHIEAAIQRAGSEAKLGEATGYSQNAVWQAKKRGTVTPEMALRFHRAGYISASLLRPDLWPTDQHVPQEPQAVAQCQ